MAQMEKVPDHVAAAFDRALPDDPRVERRKMFGLPAAFVSGSMFAGTFGQDVIVKLGPEGQGLEPFVPFPGRPMTGFYAVPREPAGLSGWIQKGFEYVAALPPKAAKSKKAARK